MVERRFDVELRDCNLHGDELIGFSLFPFTE